MHPIRCEVPENIAVENLPPRVLHHVQQHVHAGEVVGGDVLLLPKILPMVPPASFIRCRTFRISEPEPQAMSITLSNRFLVPVFGSLLSSVTMAESTLEICCGV